MAAGLLQMLISGCSVMLRCGKGKCHLGQAGLRTLVIARLVVEGTFKAN